MVASGFVLKGGGRLQRGFYGRTVVAERWCRRRGEYRKTHWISYHYQDGIYHDFRPTEKTTSKREWAIVFTFPRLWPARRTIQSKHLENLEPWGLRNICRVQFPNPTRTDQVMKLVNSPISPALFIGSDTRSWRIFLSWPDLVRFNKWTRQFFSRPTASSSGCFDWIEKNENGGSFSWRRVLRWTKVMLNPRR